MQSSSWLHGLAPCATAVAILIVSLPIESSYGGFTEVTSDLFCSLVLLLVNEAILARQHPSYDRLDQDNDASWSQHSTVIAASFCAFAICRSLVDVRWSTPALLPALLAIRLEYSAPSLDQSLKSTSTPLLKSLRPTLVASVLSLSLLRHPDGLTVATVSVLALAAQFVAFSQLHYLTNDQLEEGAPTVPLRTIRIILIQCLAALAFIAIAAVFTEGRRVIHVEDMMKLGLLKAIKWALVFNLIMQKTPWEIASVGSIFAHGVCESEIVSLAQSVGPAVVAVVAVAQSFFLLSRSVARRLIVLSVAIVPVCTVLLKLRQATPVQSSHPHPVAALAHQATTQFSAMLERQSSNITIATVEYKRRYGRSPPPGFDRWFEFAKSQNSPIIDEFDMIHSMMEPFWNVSPERLRANADSALSGDSVVSLKLRDGHFSSGSSHWLTTDLAGLLGSVAHDIPDFDAVFNTLDEPRVIMSRSEMDPNSDEVTRVEWYDGGRQSGSFEKMTAECDGRKTFQHAFRANQVEDFGLPFVQDISAAKDVCQHPEYRDQHGFLEEPDTFRVTNNAVPMFTQSKTSSFDDLLIPAPIYRRFYKEHVYDESQDMPWEEKHPTLYWAGSTTGSRQDDVTDWNKAHRQRFVAKAQHLQNSTQTFLTETEPGAWKAFNSTDVLSKLYDARFTAVIQCDSVACDSEKAYFHPSDRVQPSESLRSRFLFDLDGNAYSGRFYVLLRSHSAVFKQTIFQEWHDERLFPWVHYVPVSLSMDELPETMRFLALTEQGDAIAQQVAERGREWRLRALREEDQVVYMYRLLLEYARVVSDDRDVLECEACGGP